MRFIMIYIIHSLSKTLYWKCLPGIFVSQKRSPGCFCLLLFTGILSLLRVWACGRMFIFEECCILYLVRVLRLKGEGRHWHTWGWGQHTGGRGKWRIQSRVYQDMGAGGKHFYGNVQNTFPKKRNGGNEYWQVVIFRLSWDMYFIQIFLWNFNAMWYL